MATRLDLAPDLVIWQGDVRDALRQMPDNTVQCVVTSPPYLGLRDYGVSGQIGLEATVEEYVQTLVEVFRDVRRALRPDGTLWLNLGDKYNYSGGAGGDYGPGGLKDGQPKYPGLRLDEFKPKDLLMIPARVAIALQADGWYLRAAVPWLKGNAMPESVADRPSTAHEWMFLLTKSERYYYDADAIREPAVTTRPEALSWARSGKHSRLLVPGASNPQHRPDREKTYLPGAQQDALGKGFKMPEKWSNPAGRNRRTTDWWNESLDRLEFELVYHLNYLNHVRHIREHGGLLLDPEGEPLGFMVNPRPFPEAHFAVYPPDLIEPCILAGTSPMACPHCGAPWKRIVRLEGQKPGRDRNHGGRTDGRARPAQWENRQNPTMRVELGWAPTCSCEGNDGSGRCIVLDPFWGSGTTGQVALQFGRIAWGVELNPEYIEISKRRLRGAQTTLLGRV